MVDNEDEQLLDVEDRFDDDDDSDLFSSWEDTEESSDEEVAGQPSSDGRKKPEKQKKKELGKWKAELLAVTQESTSEEKLHFVAWATVGKHFFINAASFAFFVGFAIVVHLPAAFALALWVLTFLLLVIMVEYLKECRIQLQVALVILAAVAVAAGMFVLGSFQFLCLLSQYAVVPLGIGVIVLRVIEKPWARTVSNTGAWQAISGQKIVTLSTRLDLVKLFKGIFHFREHSPTLFVRLRNCCWHYMQKTGMFSHNTGIRVRMVQVDESNPETMDVTLELNDGEEVEPDKYNVMRLIRPTPETGEKDEIAIGDLAGLLKQRKFVSDKILDGWLCTSTGGEARETGGAPNPKDKETRAQKIGKWISKAVFPPDGNSIIITYLRRVDYWEGLWEHWAPRAVANVVLISIFAFPAVHLLMSMDRERRDLCNIGKSLPDTVSLGGHEVCGGETDFDCEAPCSSLLKWVDRMNDTIYTSYVELCLTFVMLPVFIFIFSVTSAQKLHNKQELIYFRRLRQPKKAITEVLRLKQTLEEVFQPSTLMYRFYTALRAWLGADPALTACGPISDAEFDLTATRGFNDCLRQVMVPISEMKSAISCEKSGMLSYGVGYDQDDGEEGTEEIKNGWKMLKFNNGLSDGSGRNFKVLFDLIIQTEDSWKLFKEWCKNEYKEQFELITATTDDQVQDSGKGSHLKKDTPIFDIMLPRGFSLTHVYVQSMPEDGLPLQIELTGSKNGAKEFWGLCDNLEHNIVKAVVDDEDSDSDDETSVLDRRLSSFPIVARFALSEQYYNNMSSEVFKELSGDGDPPQNFTSFVDRLLVPVPFKIPSEPDGKNLLFFTGISVFMGDEVPFSAMLAAARGCLKVVSVYLQCILLAFFVPVYRKLMGGDLFPVPFSLWLLLNSLSIWYQLVSFFSEFHFGQFRLSLISQCLGLLEQKTLAPTTAQGQTDEKDDSDKEDEDEEGKDGPKTNEGATEEQQAASARAAKKAAEDSRPFDLVVEDKVVGKDYDPNDENWVKQWRTKHDNVANWHATVSYLRVFVSTSRLVSQAMLVAAAIVVGVLLLVSLAQALGAGGADDGEVGANLAKAAAGGQAASRRLHEDVSFALAAMAEGHPASTPEPVPLSMAARRLQDVLAPTRASLHSALAEQEAVLARRHSPTATMDKVIRRLAEAKDDKPADESLLSKAAKLDITKATKTQVFTIVMVAFVLLYSVPLMWNIVKVNEFFDRHEDILLKQKELHRINQSKREVGKMGKSGPGAKSETDSVMPTTSNPTGGDDSGGDKSKGAPALDPEGKRYERLLDMSIEASRKSRERFPLKLFGFVITAQLLATWVFLATSPIVSQLKQMAPTLAMQGCTWLEGSRFVNTLQKQMDITNPSMHIHIKDMVHNNICIPLGKALQNKLSNLDLGDKIKAKIGAKKPPIATPTAAPAKKTLRRLQAEHQESLAESLRRWSSEHSDKALETRFAMAQAALSELRRDADRLLVAAPRAAVEGWAMGGEAGFWAAMGTVRPHLQLALADLEQDEESVSSSGRRDASEL